MILYKYRQCSNTTDAIFTGQKIWLAKATTLNDPCECSMHDLAPDWVAEQVRQMRSAQMTGALSGLLPRVLSKAMKETIPKIDDFDAKYAAFRKLYEKHLPVKLSDPAASFSNIEERLSSVGVFSLAESPEHPLMWSHYGQEHKGICLGFEVKDLTPSTDRERFLKVRYTDDIPKMTEGFTHQVSIGMSAEGMSSRGSIPLTDATLRAAISTKATCWEYEREWRYIEPEGNALYPFPGPLMEIVFGFRCSAEDKQRYTELARKHLSNDVRLYEMRRIKNSFTFERILLGVSSSVRDVTDKPKVPESVDETSMASRYPRIQALMEAGQFSRAVPLIDKALKKDPKSAQLWRAKGVALGLAQQHEDALACFIRATDLHPGFFSAWYHRGVSLMHLQKYDGAIAAYEQARSLNSGDASTLHNLGMMYAAVDQVQKAKELLRAADEAGHPRAHETLGDIEEWEKKNSSR